jgi:hypothetical protein
MAKKSPSAKTVESLKHKDSKRKNIPTAEFQSVVQKEQESPCKLKYPRNTDLDPQLVWRGKDEQDWSDLVVHAPPLYIQEKVHPKVLIDDLLRETEQSRFAAVWPSTRLVRGLQRRRHRCRQNRVLSARPELVEPHDPRRLPPSHGELGRARRTTRQRAVHLPRPALRHHLQQQLPVVHHQQESR